MSYFDTYMKRINRYGSNPQERIQGKREHDFKVFMNKSPNLVRAWNNKVEGDSYKAVLQTKEYDQDEVTDYLLVPLKNEIPMGTIIYTEDSRHKQVTYEGKTYSARRWINYAIDPYTSAGYNRYTVVELESELSWVDEGIKYTAFAHATGGGSGARDKNINLKFRMQFSEAGVYLPNKRYSIVMPTHSNIKKNMKVTLGGETWRVAGFDNISVKGVSYVTLEETLTDEREDIPIANAGQLKNWTVVTDRGANFSVEATKSTYLTVSFYYNGNLRSLPFKVLPNDNYETEQSGTEIKITPTKTIASVPIETSLNFVIDGWPSDQIFTVPFVIDDKTTSLLEVSGTNVIYMGDVEEYKIYNVGKKIPNISLKFTNAEILKISEIDPIDGSITVVILGKAIGKNVLYVDSYALDFEVKSMWLGGDD